MQSSSDKGLGFTFSNALRVASFIGNNCSFSFAGACGSASFTGFMPMPASEKQNYQDNRNLKCLYYHKKLTKEKKVKIWQIANGTLPSAAERLFDDEVNVLASTLHIMFGSTVLRSSSSAASATKETPTIAAFSHFL
jgi:hypothetical protein